MRYVSFLFELETISHCPESVTTLPKHLGDFAALQRNAWGSVQCAVVITEYTLDGTALNIFQTRMHTRFSSLHARPTMYASLPRMPPPPPREGGNEVINQWIILSSQIYRHPHFKVVDKIFTFLISTLCEIGMYPAKAKTKRSHFRHTTIEKLFSNCILTFLIRCFYKIKNTH